MIMKNMIMVIILIMMMMMSTNFNNLFFLSLKKALHYLKHFMESITMVEDFYGSGI